MKKDYLIYKLSEEMKKDMHIDIDLFKKMNVKRGLRNDDGTGVLVGLTNIGNVVGYEKNHNGELVPIDGKLYYRGYEITELVHNGGTFEEIIFLLLSGRLPDHEELDNFKELIYDNMPLEHQTVLHILELQGDDIMNILARSVMEFYTFDENPDDISRDNLMRQSIELISKFPTIISYAYNMYRHQGKGKSLHIRHVKPNVSLAENFLYMLKGKNYTNLEVKTLDLLLMLHAEHGGGNNSTFTVRVVSSSGTDTYSAIAAGIGSLKGPKHGGANIKVSKMISYLKDVIDDWNNLEEIEMHLNRIFNKEAFDNSGLIYGIGHAVYTKSDPRAILLKEKAYELAKEKNRLDEFEFLNNIEKVAVRLLSERLPNKHFCANVDFYSGFVYDCIDIPKEIYTPLFAMARIVGWCAHRNEELTFKGSKIIRPAYKCINNEKQYKEINLR